MKHSRKRGIARALKVVKGVSPVLAVLLMIAITVIAAIVAYMWLMGYFSTTTSKIDKAIQIQSAAYTGSHLAIYVQNVGKGTVRFVASQCLYVDGVLRDKATINPDTLQETTTAMVIEEISLSLSQTIKIKVVTDEGIFVEATVTIETFTGDYALTMLVIGSGSVTMVPSGSLYYYDNVQLTALPDSHWRFLRWEGDVSGSANPASIYVDGDKSVTVIFEQYQFQVAFSHSGLDNTATGTVVSVTIGIDMYQESFADLPFTTPWLDTGTVVTYSYTPTVLSSTPDKQFVSEGVTGPASPITVTTSETVTGNYGTRYYLTVSSPYGSASGEGWYDSGTPAYAGLDTNVVDHGNGTRRVFAEWSVDATGTDYTQSDAIIMDGSKTAVALWRTQYLVSFAVDPIEGGTTDPGTDNWYNEGVSGVQISATSNIGYAFSTWSSNTPDVSIALETDPSTTMTINGPGTITAHFTRIEYALVLNVNPGGSGTVTPDNPGPYYYGDVVQLTAQGNLGWGFFSWSGDLTGSNNPENIVINGDKSVTATFSQQTFVIHASAGQHGDISPSGDVVVVYGSDQSFDFAADPNYRVDNVVVDMVSQGPMDQYIFNGVIADHTILVSFVLNTHTITASAGVGGTITPSGSIVVNHGSDRSFTIAADIGYHIADVTVDSVSQGPIGSYPFVNVVADHTITAFFGLNEYPLVVNIVGSGTVTKNPDQATYHYNDPVQLTANPSAGWAFSGWSVDLTGSTNPDTVTIDETPQVTATFIQIQYSLTINVSPAGWGTVTKNPDRPLYDLGTVVQLMAIPSNGRRFIGWSGDLTGSTNPTSITMSSDKTVTATFATGTATSIGWTTWPSQVTIGNDFSSIGILSPGLNGRTIYLTFTKPDGTKIVSSTTTFWLLVNGVFYAQITPDVLGTWSVSATFLGDSTYGAFTTTPRAFDVVPVPQYTVSFRQTGAGVAPTVTYHIDSGSDQQGIVPFDVMVNEDSTIYYTYQATVPGATNIQYVLTNTNPSSPETITSSRTITGTYDTQYYLTFVVNPPGTGTINRATDWYDSGSLSITATANSGYAFSSWSSDTPSITFANSGSSTTTATIGGPGTITASFTRQVTFVSAGTGSGATGSGNNPTPQYPTGLQANDLILLQVTVRDTSNTPTTPSGFTLLYGPDSTGTGRQWIYYRFSTGTESGTVTVTIAGSSTKMARMYAFRGVALSSFTEGGSFGSGTSSTISARSVTTTGNGRLAVSFVFVNDNNDVGSFSGESGGNWQEATGEFLYNGPGSGDDGCIQLQIATMGNPGTISGGTEGMSDSDPWGVRAFALIP